jgi:hypothetical protein
LATRTITGAGRNRQADRLKLYLTALALRRKALVLCLVHDGFQFLSDNYWKLRKTCREGSEGEVASVLSEVRFSPVSDRIAEVAHFSEVPLSTDLRYCALRKSLAEPATEQSFGTHEL